VTTTKKKKMGRHKNATKSEKKTDDKEGYNNIDRIDGEASLFFCRSLVGMGNG
jgi:hypothetical protein